MHTEVVTSFSPAGAEIYGRRCVASVQTHWPHPLVVYADAPLECKGVTVRNTAHIPHWLETKEQLPTSRPDAPLTGVDRWTRKPTSYLWDAQRFAVKVFVWLDAAKRMESGLLVWLDGDTVTTADVPAGLIADLMQGTDVAYLGRGAMHPETGFVAFRIPEALPVLRGCVEAYQWEWFRALAKGWTDCHVLWAALTAMPVQSRDLTSHIYPGEWRSSIDAMALSPLGPYVRHLKGSHRKQERAA